MKSASIRPHRKSRRGCRTCKGRKIRVSLLPIVDPWFGSETLEGKAASAEFHCEMLANFPLTLIGWIRVSPCILWLWIRCRTLSLMSLHRPCSRSLLIFKSHHHLRIFVVSTQRAPLSSDFSYTLKSMNYTDGRTSVTSIDHHASTVSSIQYTAISQIYILHCQVLQAQTHIHLLLVNKMLPQFCYPNQKACYLPQSAHHLWRNPKCWIWS